MIEELEKEFSNTTKLLLGAELKGLEEYGEWIGKRVPIPERTTSAISGNDVWIPTCPIYLKKRFYNARSISLDEMEKLPKTHFNADEIKNSTIKDMINKFIEPVNYYCGNFRHWTYANVEKCSGAGDGRNIMYGDDTYRGVKNISHGWYVLFSQNAFGCYGVMNSSFLIHAYNSTKITRCFEVDGCKSSSGLVFCYNCENVQDSMFCFNTKNLRYAIGNTVIGAEEYKRIRSMVLNEIVNDLQEKKSYERDIFNIRYMG
ncbi:hypothetical protein KKF81_02490 [Candidatus Micrarchaeota archaeon]|nr:hypothetical protein [Candidatus Micrarchaeota archaeon]MBU1165789.1 hypothetical protein [Candidatus Micrarchaeota archaeon]MBU1886295.1 hypothetical protein [Candidatus Micrarchaeota archaeon]